jgi:hypothetical protein
MASVVGSCEIKKASCNRYCENLLRKIRYKNLGKGEKKKKGEELVTGSTKELRLCFHHPRPWMEALIGTTTPNLI